MNEGAAISHEASEGGTEGPTRRFRGLARGVYAVIILTALLFGLEEHTESASDALAAIVATAGILFVAHAYSDVLAEQMGVHRMLHWEEARELLIVESPLLIAAIVPVLLFALAEAGTISIDRAYQVSIVYALASLFLIGTLLGRSTGQGLAGSLIPGAIYGGLGATIIVLEAAID